MNNIIWAQFMANLRMMTIGQGHKSVKDTRHSFTDNTHKVENCMYFSGQRRAQNREALVSTTLSDRPWKKIGIDLCEHETIS